MIIGFIILFILTVVGTILCCDWSDMRYNRSMADRSESPGFIGIEALEGWEPPNMALDSLVVETDEE